MTGLAVSPVERGTGVQLEIPPDPEYVSLARMLVASVTFERRDIDDERLEDLVLAVSEACSRAVSWSRTGPGRPVTVTWSEDADGCSVTVSGAARAAEARALAGGAEIPTAGETPDPGSAVLEGDMVLPLINALVDDVVIIPDDRSGEEASAAVTLRMECPPAPPARDQA
ncbi:MAG TPA: ATP-binding protein [Acidimicrobiales bacterium]|nr:ATP-binding protein [Acidimicrobiales bacterium]